MPTVAIDPDSVRDFTLKDDHGKEGSPTFQLGVIDAFLRAYLDDKYLQMDADGNIKGLRTNRLSQKLVEFARFGLRGWKNLVDEKGNPVTYETEEDTESGVVRTVIRRTSLRRLPAKVLMEIGYELSKTSTLSDEAVESFQ